MTKLDDIKRITQASSPGPWRTHAIYNADYGEVFGPKSSPLSDRVTLDSQADATFIAMARNEMEKLLAVIEAGDILAAAAYDMSRKPENQDDEEAQHGRLNEACAAYYDAKAALEL